jgi:hypothetical protein
MCVSPHMQRYYVTSPGVVSLLYLPVHHVAASICGFYLLAGGFPKSDQSRLLT